MVSLQPRKIWGSLPIAKALTGLESRTLPHATLPWGHRGPSPATFVSGGAEDGFSDSVVSFPALKGPKQGLNLQMLILRCR